MLPDKQCMIDILKFISENNQVKVTDDAFLNINLGSFYVSKFLKDMSNKTNYDINTIAYNFIQCYNNDFVEAKINFQGNIVESSKSRIYGVTFKGIEFMN